MTVFELISAGRVPSLDLASGLAGSHTERRTGCPEQSFTVFVLLELQKHSFHSRLDLLLGQGECLLEPDTTAKGGWCQGSRNALSSVNPGAGGFTLPALLAWSWRALSWGGEEGGSFFSVGALSSLSGLWVPCVTIGASSVAGSEEWIHPLPH